MGKTVEEMREYKAKWARERRLIDPDFAKRQNENSARGNKRRSFQKRQIRADKFNILGKTYGLLSVVDKLSEGNNREKIWVCDCNCGSKKLIKTYRELANGFVKSCGCLKKTINVKHGDCRRSGHTAEYDVWTGIQDRCTDPNNPNWNNYGGRGICVCERWMIYANFLADMGRRPSPNHSIERRDNYGHYEPSNCYWATKKEQANNRRSNVHLKFNNETHNIKQWAEILNIPYLKFYHLVRTKKLTVAEAVLKYASI